MPAHASDRPLDHRDLERLFPGLKQRAHALLEQRGKVNPGIGTTELAQSGVRRQKRASEPWSALRWKDDDHFYAASYNQMVLALRDKARAREARPDREQAGDLASEFLAPRIQAGALRLSDLMIGAETPSDLAAAVVDALEWLKSKDPDLGRLMIAVEMQGRTPEELAGQFGVSARSLRTWLTYAKSLVAERLTDDFPKLNVYLSKNGPSQLKPGQKVRRNPRATRRRPG